MHAGFTDFEKNMKIKQCLAIGVLAALPFAAGAQQPAQKAMPPAGPQDAHAPAPALTYASAFANYKAASDDAASPEQAWRAANDAVNKLGGHAGDSKGNAQASRAASPMAPMPMQHGHHHH